MPCALQKSRTENMAGAVVASVLVVSIALNVRLLCLPFWPHPLSGNHLAGVGRLVSGIRSRALDASYKILYKNLSCPVNGSRQEKRSASSEVQILHLSCLNGGPML